MCKVYNQIGSLTTIKAHLHKNGVNEFNSVNDLLNFQKNYFNNQQQIISKHSILIEQEMEMLKGEIKQLEILIETNKNEISEKLQIELTQLKHQLDIVLSSPSNIIKKLIYYFKKFLIKRKIRNIEFQSDSIIKKYIQSSINTLSIKSSRHNYIISHLSEAINESSSLELKELDRKKRIIDDINSTIYGAIGEQKVYKDLENLSDDYHLINDFTCSFKPAIYNQQGNDYIKSVQIDHILISPSGIFLIETKNWSEHSINNISLRSPVEQIKRTSFALFKMLSGKIISSLNQHHWGNRKIPIRNLIVLINHKPIEEFQYVKVLSLKELRNYVEYFKPSFSNNETQMIASYLLRLNGQIINIP